MKKEMIRAIRLVNGFNPDLRIVLYGVNRNSLYDWIEANRLGIFGISFYPVKPVVTSLEWDKYDNAILKAVHQVIFGKENI